MKNITGILFIVLFATFLLTGAGDDDFPELSGAYLGQKCPVDKAEVFLDGVISKNDEPQMCAAFNKAGIEFFYNALHNGNFSIFVTRLENGKWTKPGPMPFTADYLDRDFTLSPDGNTLYWGSNRPREKGGDKLSNLDIYFSKRLPDGAWTEPTNIGPVINSLSGENYPSVAANGNLYFFSYGRDGGFGGCDLYFSRMVNGQYQTPENLGPAINSDKHDWDSYIAPDESYIIFSSKDREDTLGTQDLYISYKDKKGDWTRAINMGARVNSVADEICPSVSPDGKYLFFTSRRRGKADIFWIETKVINDLRPAALK